jgi:hypothetical protein
MFGLSKITARYQITAELRSFHPAIALSKIAARYQITAVKVAIDRAPRGKFSCPISQPDHIPFLAVQGLKFSPVIGWRSQVANWPKSLLAYLP